ncbi:BglG family transcription antiterminator [Pectinatus frisingensis]|uniref:BglG family transcription antiterminator n=1 Tax=Pectinatus frisingensis TaxID=865 RepID=UPI0015F68AD8|nr:PTS sugar transporter subunit IIA [Pectinatus frisingensis]
MNKDNIANDQKKNLLTSRQKKILAYLNGQEDYITSDQIAETLEVSSRTVKNDIKELKNISKQLGVEICSQRTRGYLLIVHDNQTYGIYSEGSYIDLNVQNDRVVLLLQRLLAEKNFVQLNDLAEYLNISLSTLHTDLKLAKLMLKEDRIFIVSQPNKGIKVEGNEGDIRSALSRYINANFLLIRSYDSILNKNVLSTNGIKILSDFLVDILRNAYDSFLGLEVTNLLIHIVIIISRNKSGFYVQFNDSRISIKMIDSKERNIANKIADFLRVNFDINLPQEEVYYLSFCILRHCTPNNNLNAVDSFLKDVYYAIKQTFGIEIKTEHEGYDALYYHSVGLCNRSKYKLQISDKQSLEFVKNKFILAYEMAMIYKRLFKKNFSNDLNDIEIYYITIHFGAILESQKLENTLPTVLLVTEMRLGKVLLLKNELMFYLRSYIKRIDILSPYAINEEVLKKYKFVLSTESLRKLHNFFIKNFLLIPFELNNLVIKQIKNYLTSKLVPEDIFKETVFFLNPKVKNVNDLIMKMAKNFWKLGYIDDYKSFYYLTMQREKLQSTHIGYVLAMPHPIRSASKVNFISVSIFSEGLKWFDGNNVKLVFYVGFTGNKKEETARIFDLLSLICSNDKLIDELILAKSSVDFISILKSATTVYSK